MLTGVIGSLLQGHIPTKLLEYVILTIFTAVGIILVLNATVLQSLLD